MTLSPTITRRVLLSVATLLLVLVAVVASKESGLLDSFASKRGVVAVLALMMVLMGNFLPKLAAPGTGARTRRAERYAGWSLILGGLAMVPTALLVADRWAPSAAAVVGLTGLLTAALCWRLGQTQRAAVDDTRMGLRNAFGHLLLAIAWVLAMFPADLLLGDASTWPMLIGYFLSSFALISWTGLPWAPESPPLA